MPTANSPLSAIKAIMENGNFYGNYIVITGKNAPKPAIPMMLPRKRNTMSLLHGHFVKYDRMDSVYLLPVVDEVVTAKKHTPCLENFASCCPRLTNIKFPHCHSWRGNLIINIKEILNK